MPNLVGFDLDDLFLDGAARKVKTPQGDRLVLPILPGGDDILNRSQVCVSRSDLR